MNRFKVCRIVYTFYSRCRQPRTVLVIRDMGKRKMFEFTWIELEVYLHHWWTLLHFARKNITVGILLYRELNVCGWRGLIKEMAIGTNQFWEQHKRAIQRQLWTPNLAIKGLEYGSKQTGTAPPCNPSTYSVPPQLWTLVFLVSKNKTNHDANVAKNSTMLWTGLVSVFMDVGLFLALPFIYGLGPLVN